MLGRASDRWASVVFAVVLHALVAFVLIWGWSHTTDYQISKPIRQITATLVETPQPQAAPERAVQPRPQPTRPPARQESRPEPSAVTPSVIETPTEQSEAPPVQEQPRTQPEPARRQPIVDELSFDSLLEQEDEVRQADNETAVEMSQIQVMDAKFQAQVGAKWSRPPSARNGMEVLVRIQFLPNGEVLSVTVSQSSGDSAFDRSAVSAIERGAPYRFLMDYGAPFFNKNYRNKLALFRPEDLK
ncbi:TonB family protein [Umboniibacter marinipuniceus]|uniref:Cell division and transport-associated protein TolA n=1 Tax=Umboniibacter marinipuniceus TaxID=569599 RepID=A0A3M0AJN6_9GAMM|nr:TonB family protein [Umboniibacter marinipuniceus]RMA79252.1 cell division and transport-associated protein TolA [Umboniibacter marinipuniceus]